jgi:formylglycine-generating enzyme required for sulfatase activity
MEQVFPTGFGYSPGGSPGNCDIAGSSGCISEFGAFDLSGNLREWTATQVSASFQVRGGSYTDARQGATCDNDFIKLTPASAFNNLGFRCCRSDEPPMAP